MSLLHLRLRLDGCRPEGLHRARREQPREDERADRTRRLRVHGRDLLRPVRAAAEPPERDVVRVRPERLRVREEGVEPGDERRTPQVGRRPAVGQELGRRGERQRVRLEEREEVREEEPGVRGELRGGGHVSGLRVRGNG